MLHTTITQLSRLTSSNWRQILWRYGCFDLLRKEIDDGMVDPVSLKNGIKVCISSQAECMEKRLFSNMSSYSDKGCTAIAERK